MSNVVFINTLYYPNTETQIKLNFYQEQYCLYHAEMDYKIKELKLTPGEVYLYRKNSHQKVRDTWYLVPTPC